MVTVHDEVVAEIRTSPLVKPGAVLLKLRKEKGVKRTAKKYPISGNVKDHLCVAEKKP